MKIVCSFLFAVFLSTSFFAYADDERMNFDFDAIPSKTALQLISDFARLNLIGADDVDGTLTMRMKSVTWQKALEYVAKTKNLHYEIEGNVLYVSRDPKYFDSLDSPLPVSRDDNKNTIFNIKHMLASEAIAGFPLFSKEFNQESVSANDAAGIVVARLSPSRLEELASYLRAVDFPRAQVMIEARIVEVERSFSKKLGVNWSGTIKAGNLVGKTAGTFVDVGSLPVSGGIGFVSSSAVLELELAAMEKGGYGKVIDRPNVFARDKQQARFVKGSEVPYQQTAGQGATSTSFKEAALSLDVTPFIDDTGVRLDIKLAKDEPDFANALNGVPPIKTVNVSSNVRVKLGDTVALGGVYSTIQTTQEHRVPGLASIPFLGSIFRYESQSTSDSELILFITPTLVPSVHVAQVR
ncbi:secretin and TonB N-terminal domain-containing protein [Pseudomonas helleri]|uniref:secretin and TonB N-terminal domain-containing protein n=1 Tax=Pseudomonas helleri TaxID=1608996 RepID=UPI003F9503BE